jgi:hypothetical protein
MSPAEVLNPPSISPKRPTSTGKRKRDPSDIDPQPPTNSSERSHPQSATSLSSSKMQALMNDMLAVLKV